jgi:hypothetical protein
MHQGPSSEKNRTSSSRDNAQGISKEKRRPKDGVMMQYNPQTLTYSQSQLEPARAQGMAALKSLFTNQADPRFTNQEVVVYEMTPEQKSGMGMPNNQLVSMDQEKMFSSEKMGTQLTPKEESVGWESRDQFSNKN